MRVVEPIAIIDAMMLGSNIAEDDAAVWNVGTSYTTGQTVIRDHAVFEAVAASTGQDPQLDTTSTYSVSYTHLTLPTKRIV